MLYAAGIAILTAVLTSVLPVLVSLRSNVFESLKDGRGRIGGRGTTARAVLVSLQIACAFALVAGCGLLVRSLAAYTSANLGYPTSGLIDVYGPPINAGLYPSRGAQLQYIHRLDAKLAAVPGVRGVAFGTAVPLMGGGSDGTLDIAGGPKDADADFQFLSPGYFRVLGVPIVRGRAFSARDNASSRAVAIVNREFVKRFIPHDAPLGKTFAWGGTRYTIIGIVPDIALHYVGEPVRPAMYFNLIQLSGQDFSGDFIPWMVRSDVAPNAALTKAIAQAWKDADPREPSASLYTVAQMVEFSTSKTRANVFVLGALALIALLLAISGTASVVAYAVARRTNEIGVRMALGAWRWRIVRALLGGAAAMLAVGLIAGLGLAALAAHSLEPQLYQTPPFDPQTYVAVALILAIATLGASFVPAYRAATIDPSTALRYE